MVVFNCAYICTRSPLDFCHLLIYFVEAIHILLIEGFRVFFFSSALLLFFHGTFRDVRDLCGSAMSKVEDREKSDE